MVDLAGIFLGAVGPIVANAAVGYVLDTARDVDPEPLNTAVLYVLAPALVFHSLAVTELDAGTLVRLGVGVVAFTAAMWAVAEVVDRSRRNPAGACRDVLAGAGWCDLGGCLLARSGWCCAGCGLRIRRPRVRIPPSAQRRTAPIRCGSAALVSQFAGRSVSCVRVVVPHGPTRASGHDGLDGHGEVGR